MPQPHPGPAPTLLLTGFEPFGGDEANPSWEIAARLEGWEVREQAAARRDNTGRPAPLLAVVRSVQLPCVFHQALAVLDAACERFQPVAVIALGLAASRAEISVERVAINVDDARIPDNAGRQPIDSPVCHGGPVAYWSSLPIKRIVAAMRAAGIEASVSQSAGTFVCNHVFYGLAHRLAAARASSAPAPRGGFIHVPWPGDWEPPAPVHGVVAGSMQLDTLAEAIRIAIRVTLTAGEGDLKLPGGAIA